MFPSLKNPPWLPVAVAITVFAAAVALRLALLALLGTSMPYVTFFPAVMFAALFGGLYAGYMVTVLSACFAAYFLIDPAGDISARHAGDWLGMVIFFLSCLMVSWLSEFMRRAEKRTGEAEARAMSAAEREKAGAALLQSEAKFRSYVENSPMAVLVVDREGHYVDFNAAAVDLLGYPAETLARMHILEVHRIEDHVTVLSDFARLFDTGRVNVETCMQRGDGETVWVSLHAALLDRDHAIAYCQDISGIRAAVESMRERLALQEQLAAITSVVPGVIHSFRRRADGSFCFPYASAALESICGLQPAQVSQDATAALNLIHPEDRERVNRCIEESARGMTPLRDEFRVRLPGKGDIWVECHSIPSREADGSILWRGFIHDITQRRGNEELVREATRRLQLAVKSAGLGVWEWDIAAGSVVWNDRMCELYGIAPTDFDGRHATWSGALHPEDRDRTFAACREALVGEKEFNTEFRVIHPGGRVKTLKGDAVVVRDQASRPLRMVGLNRDITDQRYLEAQLLQSQKMEAVGRLAGGVAHEFNNNLSVILGYAELSKLVEVDSSKFREYLDEIIKAAEHSRDVTHQLLAFSRHEIIAPRRVDLNLLIGRSEKTLWRLIGEDVELILTTSDHIWPVLIDPAQLNQVVMNLVVNARDAMPHGGTLSIETTNVALDEICRIGTPETRPGEYVRMTVTDTGVGMDGELQGRVFEPFFTTKGVGKGTGLGLATVYGIMSQNGGFIKVSSEPGEGASFSLFFPRMNPEQAAGQAQEPAMDAGAGGVLLVEDEPTVRLMAQLMLEKIGYSVLVAASPQEALEKCRRSEGGIDCLLTDVIMPGMSGVDLSVAARAICPGIGIVYMSGYSSDLIAPHGVLEPGVLFLQKPFDAATLAEKIQQSIRFSRTP
ncbi:MAG: hypothetical protein A2075_21865 [Geobacteraceae bacterium GWC2_58_44]|nr:MAG: hypothetical protein A2075_21865 [Geobacteraceae bacterium GWC2_58_44]